MNNTEKRIIKIAKKLFKCDAARIANYDKKFLVIGNIKNTNDYEYSYYKNGKSIDFNFLDEHCIASGKIYLELFKDMRKYLCLTKTTMEEYLLSLKIYQ